MRYPCLLLALLFSSVLLNAQSVEERLQFAIDSIQQAHPESIGIMAHVEAPEKNVSWSGASGKPSKTSAERLDPSAPALIASSIKTLIAATMLRFVEQGELTLETPIAGLIHKRTRKRFEKDGYDLSAIQIKHLLSHTSGIANYGNDDYIERIDNDKLHRWTRDEQLDLTLEVGDPLGNPGDQFSYTDANYLLLTEIMETLSGEAFYTVIRKQLKYDALGLDNTWFPTLEDKPKGTPSIVHQYWSEKDWDSAEIDISIDLYGGGGIACPPRDLARFIQHFFAGDIVANDSIRSLIFTEIKTPQTADNPYYLGLSQNQHNGLTGYGHGGFWGTVMLHFPAINSSIAVYILDKDAGALRRDVMEALTKIMAGEYADRLMAYTPSGGDPELSAITHTLNDYIEGTANGQPERLRRAFHPDFNLYTVTEEDSLRIRSGEKYISNVQPGKKNNRIGRIISIDYENDAAIAKAEIVIPGWRIFTDYFLLLKYEGSWKIVHKSYTWRPLPQQVEGD